MIALMAEMNRWALELGVPPSVRLDVTYRSNERCVHCYLDHADHGEMSTAEIRDLLDQLADAGVFFLTLSGGEILIVHSGQMRVFNYTFTSFHGSQATGDSTSTGTGPR